MRKHFIEVCKKVLKVNGDKSRVVVTKERKGGDWCLWMRDNQIKYLGFVFDKSVTDRVEWCRSVLNARVLHKGLLVLILVYGNETMAQMDIFMVLLVINRIDKKLIAYIRVI